MFLKDQTSLQLKLIKEGHGYKIGFYLRINFVRVFIIYELVNKYYPEVFYFFFKYRGSSAVQCNDCSYCCHS
jgi:hypothetical protein